MNHSSPANQKNKATAQMVRAHNISTYQYQEGRHSNVFHRFFSPKAIPTEFHLPVGRGGASENAQFNAVFPALVPTEPTPHPLSQKCHSTLLYVYFLKTQTSACSSKQAHENMNAEVQRAEKINKTKVRLWAYKAASLGVHAPQRKKNNKQKGAERYFALTLTQWRKIQTNQRSRTNCFNRCCATLSTLALPQSTHHARR